MNTLDHLATSRQHAVALVWRLVAPHGEISGQNGPSVLETEIDRLEQKV